MNAFADIHCHALFGVDDGAPDETTMYEMLRMSYEDGTRALCLTPHCSFDHMPSPHAVEEAFGKAEQYCRLHFPEMRLYLGNELSYRFEGIEMLASGNCRTMAGSRYVLLDFFTVRDGASVVHSVSAVQNAGYIPIVAHVERYPCFYKDKGALEALVETGALLQINASSVLEGVFSPVGRMARKLLAKRQADVIASDGHDLRMRPPLLSHAYCAVEKKYGERYARRLFFENPSRILSGKRIQVN